MFRGDHRDALAIASVMTTGLFSGQIDGTTNDVDPLVSRRDVPVVDHPHERDPPPDVQPAARSLRYPACSPVAHDREPRVLAMNVNRPIEHRIAIPWPMSGLYVHERGHAAHDRGRRRAAGYLKDLAAGWTSGRRVAFMGMVDNRTSRRLTDGSTSWWSRRSGRRTSPVVIQRKRWHSGIPVSPRTSEASRAGGGRRHGLPGAPARRPRAGRARGNICAAIPTAPTHGGQGRRAESRVTRSPTSRPYLEVYESLVDRQA